MLCVAALCGGAFAFGERRDVSPKKPSEPTFVPLNSRLCRMGLQDGTKFVFVRDLEDRLLMRGPGPWMAGERPEWRMVNVFTDPKFKGEPKEYCFVDGHLRFMSVGKKDCEFKPSDWAAPTNTIESLWPKAKMTAEEKRAADIWRGGGRLRLISRNPNRTGLLIAEALSVTIGLVLFASSFIWRIHFLLQSCILICLLFRTESRGAFLAFCAASSILLAFWFVRNRLFRRRHFLIAGMVMAIFVGCGLCSSLGKRIVSSSADQDRDESTASRLVMWKEFPRMVAAAPWGWGIWKSGPVYNAWFERQENMHMTGDLFNDHLSRFVEGGFLLGGLYVLAWATLLIGGLMLALRGRPPILLAIWSAYWVAACFNPMIWWKPTLYLPLAVTFFELARLVHRREVNLRRLKFLLLGSGATTSLVLAEIGVIAFLAPAQDIPLSVSALGRRVVIGHGEPKVWVADDRYVLCGDYNGFPGKEIREYYQAHPNAEPMGLVERLEDLPKKTDRLVVTGKLCRPYLDDPGRTKADHVILMSPPFGSRDVLREFRRNHDLHLLTGEFAARLTGDDRRKAKWIHVVRGAETYIPGWLDIVVRKNERTDKNETTKKEG